LERESKRANCDHGSGLEKFRGMGKYALMFDVWVIEIDDWSKPPLDEGKFQRTGYKDF